MGGFAGEAYGGWNPDCALGRPQGTDPVDTRADTTTPHFMVGSLCPCEPSCVCSVGLTSAAVPELP
jgi:hypothetical protein